MTLLENAVLDTLAEALADTPGAPDRETLAGAFARPPTPEQGDLAFPCFVLAKALRLPPPKIAADLAARLRTGGLLARVEAVGPYLNVFADPAALLAELCASLADGRFDRAAETDAPARVMIEFSQPNTHKVFHVGHLRNVAVGDCLVRVFRARGHTVVAANYYGDFGIDVAKCLWWIENRVDVEPPETGRGAWLGAAYVACNDHIAALEAEGRTAERDELFGRLRGVLADSQGGTEPYASLYRRTRQWCLDEFAEVYDWLGVSFDHAFYESEVEEEGQALVDEYLSRGVFEPSEGAIVCRLDDFGLGPALVRKSDGTSLYLTWDLALARRKFQDFEIEHSLYVVGAEQSYHFRQLFATLQRMGYEHAADCRHVAYELVMRQGEDGPEKMSSRAGTTIPLHVLRDEIAAALDRTMEADERTDRSGWTDEQRRRTVHRLSVACLKYGMLGMSNTSRVVFDMDAWTSFEGDTGAYLLYGLARISGIFRKGGRPGLEALASRVGGADGFGAPAERALLGHLLRYGETLAAVEREVDPCVLATFVHEGTRLFTRFYHDCPVLKSDEPLRSARLGLVAATEAVLGRAVRHLGIEPVEAM